eukprot:INCI10961.1.p1 GENE.INCI10961.1~~INCI10961.1.p1  ORF type:complete len:140 (+),score=19.87 INCI10961.1:46-420(+)
MSTTEPGGASTLRQRRGKPGEMNAQTKSTELMGGTFAPTAAEVATWRVKDVVDFVDNNLELSAIAPLFAESSVAGPDLLDIEADDLVQMGVENHMHRKKNSPACCRVERRKSKYRNPVTSSGLL